MRNLQNRVWDLEVTVCELFYVLQCLLADDDQPIRKAEIAKAEFKRAQALFLSRVSGADAPRHGGSEEYRNPSYLDE